MSKWKDVKIDLKVDKSVGIRVTDKFKYLGFPLSKWDLHN